MAPFTILPRRTLNQGPTDTLRDRIIKQKNVEARQECVSVLVEGNHFVLREGLILPDDSVYWADPAFIKAPIELARSAPVQHKFEVAMTRPGEQAWSPIGEEHAALFSVFARDPNDFGDSSLVDLEIQAIRRTHHLLAKVLAHGLTIDAVLERVAYSKDGDEIVEEVGNISNDGQSKLHRIKAEWF